MPSEVLKRNKINFVASRVDNFDKFEALTTSSQREIFIKRWCSRIHVEIQHGDDKWAPLEWESSDQCALAQHLQLKAQFELFQHAVHNSSADMIDSLASEGWPGSIYTQICHSDEQCFLRDF